MPREYQQSGSEVYINWYAATAESGTRAMTSGSASDSVCPAGWQLPYLTNSVEDKSWRGILAGVYAEEYGSELSIALREYPVSMPSTGGYYSYHGDIINKTTTSYIFSSTAAARNSAKRIGIDSGGVNVDTNTQKITGESVRCVKR